METMNAAVYTKYGPPDVVQLGEVAKPVPEDDEMLVRIHTSTVTPTDCAFRQANPLMIRFMNGFMRPRNKVLGTLLAGEVEAVGKDVTKFQVGDSVFGSTDTNFGAHAEYLCMPEEGVVAVKPANMSHEEAVGVPEALTPLYFLRELAHIQPGQKLLINGASGAVGTYAIQLAKHFGAEVTGVCSTRNVELVKSLGADRVIDYTQEDFTRNGQQYDIIFDAVGKSSFARCKGSLTPNGRYLVTVVSLPVVLQMLWTSKIGSKKAILGFAGLNFSQENLLYVKKLVEDGKLRSVIDRRYPLEQIVEAYRYVEEGHKTGNVIVTVGAAQ